MVQKSRLQQFQSGNQVKAVTSQGYTSKPMRKNRKLLPWTADSLRNGKEYGKDTHDDDTPRWRHMIEHPPGTPPFSISCSNLSLSALEVMLRSLYFSLGLSGIKLATQKLNFSASDDEGLSPALATSSAYLELLVLLPTAMALQQQSPSLVHSDAVSPASCLPLCTLPMMLHWHQT